MHRWTDEEIDRVTASNNHVQNVWLAVTAELMRLVRDEMTAYYEQRIKELDESLAWYAAEFKKANGKAHRLRGLLDENGSSQ